MNARIQTRQLRGRFSPELCVGWLMTPAVKKEEKWNMNTSSLKDELHLLREGLIIVYEKCKGRKENSERDIGFLLHRRNNEEGTWNKWGGQPYRSHLLPEIITISDNFYGRLAQLIQNNAALCPVSGNRPDGLRHDPASGLSGDHIIASGRHEPWRVQGFEPATFLASPI